MGKKKHDWIKYKQNYFNSEIDDIVQFFSKYNANISKNTYYKITSSWKEEKQEFKRKQAAKAKEKLENNPNVTVATKELLKTKKLILDLARSALNNTIKTANGKNVADIELNTKQIAALKIVWDIVKTELGEPTVIRKSDDKTSIELGEDSKAFLDAIKK